ncbi:preprotein translocase subunit YajC [Bacteroides sp. 519]|uniref:preprotein translocase subunit YajC n=1 Tax=Bacteroides sp. 519 TaxID=2302937 RepID=UPI0013D5CAB8|nr:preprotein translocase subunit YajC [Bacteroides sp. 519]NDV57097.1 preprotein translocase subunit YajC [Bacteroides sp. 519]
MNLLTVLLQTGAQPAPGGGSMMWIMLIAMFAIMYFFMIRPQNKKQKEIANFRKSLEVNQKVVTAGGIHGKIKDIKEDFVILEIADNVRIKIEKSSILASTDTPSTPAGK